MSASVSAPSISARELVTVAEDRLAEAGVEGARFDAELLLAAVLGRSRPMLLASFGSAVSASDVAEFEGFVARRASREPLAYITGLKGFRSIELAVDRRVLIPRPETELLVDVVAAEQPRLILDVATGSGAVALALADELPEATVVAADISAGALDVARTNARRLGLSDRVGFEQSDLLESVTGRFNAIAANLPYVRTGEIDGLQPEIGFEPRAALDGGVDGLDLVRALVGQTRERGALKPGGVIALEIGDDQGAETCQILADSGFEAATVHRDLAGRDRVVSAKEPR